MSKVEEGNLFFRRFGRTALALSMVTTSFILADQTIAADASQFDYLENGETNTTRGAGVNGDGSGAKVTVNSGVDLNGTIHAGENVENPALPGGQPTHSYVSANDSIGTAIGLDVNDTVTDLANLGTIDADARTLDSYTTDGGTVGHPDQNNTTLKAIGVDVANPVDSIVNSGTISASAILNNDTNNSSADAVGVKIGGAVGSFVNENGSSITAIAETHRAIYDADGNFVRNELVARIGGRTGISGTINTADLGQDAHYTSTIQEDTHIGKDSKLFQDDDAKYNSRLVNDHDYDRAGNNAIDTDDILNASNYLRTDYGTTNNSHIHIENFTAEDHKAPDELLNTISAEGVTVESAITGGVTNHEYISSLRIDAALGGDDALLVTPNGGSVIVDADGDGVPANIDQDDTNASMGAPTEAELEADALASLPDLTNDGSLGNQGGASYPAYDGTGMDSPNPPVFDDNNISLDYNTSLVGPDNNETQINGQLVASNNYGEVAGKEAEASFNAEIDALGPAPDPDAFTDADAGNAAKDDYITAVNNATADNNYSAVKEDIAKAYLKSPSAGDVNTSTETPTLEAPAGLPKSGEEVARIGNTVNNSAILGAIHGVLVKASTGTNLSDEINATTGELVAGQGGDGNRSINANVTSASYSAYLGEGVDENGNSRIITRDTNSSSKDFNRLTNDLIGGFTNNLTVSAGLGGSAFTLTTDATALAAHADHIDINQTSTTDGNGTNYEDIVSNPTSIVGVGTLENSGVATAMTGGLGGSGLEIQATATGGMSTPGAITGKELVISPTSITNVREIINYGNILGGLGGYGVNGEAKATGAILAGDINASKGTHPTQQTGVVVRTHADATAGNFFTSGTIVQSLGMDAVKMGTTGSSTLALTGGTTDADVDIFTTARGGVQKVYGKDGNKAELTDGSFLNAGLITSALAMHGVNMETSGISTIGTAGKITDSDLNVTNMSTGGTEGSFGNIAWAGKINPETLKKEGIAVQRGSISSSLAMDAVHLTGSGLATLLPLAEMSNSKVEVTNITKGGVGEHFLNYGLITSSLAMNGVNLSATGSAVLLAPSIVAGETSVVNITRTGTGGDFINGASAIETGALKEGTTLVHNPLYTTADGQKELIKSRDGYYTVAAEINENNTSDTNSSGAHANIVEDLGVDANRSVDIGTDIGTVANSNSEVTRKYNQLEELTVHAYDKEAIVTPSLISASLALDAINFTALNAGTTAGTGDIKASTDERIDRGLDVNDTGDDSNKDVYNTRAKVKVLTAVDSSIGGDFVNNGSITSSLALNAVNGASTSGNIFSIGSIEASDVDQETYTRAGVRGNFYNEAVSREVGAAKFFTTREGDEEVGAFAYSRLTTPPAVISSALALNAINLESHAVNAVTIDSKAAAYVADPVGSGVTNDEQSRNIDDFKAVAGATRSNVRNSITSIAGVGKDFSNSGTISSALALNAVDGLTDGTNAVLGTIKGTNFENSLLSVGGIQGDFDNDIQSLKIGAPTPIYKDVYTIDGSNNRVDPKYYDNEDAKEGERVKSNVLDRVVYDRIHLAPTITSSLALDAVNMNAVNIAHTNAADIGVSEVEVVTNHTGYATAEENNETLVEHYRDGGADHLVSPVDINSSIFDSDRIIKVTSENVSSVSEVRAGIGGKFTNRGLISTSLALNGVTALALNTLSDSTGKIEGGNVKHSTLVVAGIGNNVDANDSSGFLNAADTYDTGAVQIGQSQVLAHNNGKAHALVDIDANDAHFDGNETHVRDANLTLANSEDVVFWNKDAAPIPGTMTAALALDVVNVSASNLMSSRTGAIKAVTGDVNVTTISEATGTDEIVAVVGHHVEGSARATVTSGSTVIAGINGGFTNQGIMTSSLALNVLQASVVASNGLLTSDVEGSSVEHNTLTVAGVQNGDFKNEMLSFDTDSGQVITQLEGDTETPTVVFSKLPNLPPVMSSALALDVVDAKVLAATNTMGGTIEASEGVKYDGNRDNDWKLETIFNAARSVSSDANSSTKTIAGIEGNFYNTGVISAKLALNGIDAPITVATNTFSSTVKGSNASATSYTVAGIQGDFTNDVATLDTGAAHVIQRDVINPNGENLDRNITVSKNDNALYVMGNDTRPAGERLESNVAFTNIADKLHEDENNYAFGLGKDGTVDDGVVYDQFPTEATLMNNALALDVVNTSVLAGTHTVKLSAIEDEVKVVRMNNTSDGTPDNEGIRSIADKEMVVDVTSDTVSNFTAIAGIGGKFTNRSPAGMTAALSLNIIDSWANGTTTTSGATVHGGHTDINSLVIAGIGNGEDNESRGIENRADSYNTTVHVNNHSMVATGDIDPVDGNRFHTADANEAIIADANESQTKLALMESPEVVYWDNKIISGNLATSLALDVFKLNAVNTATLGVTEAYAVTNEVNVSGEMQQVAGFHVTGSSVGAKVTENATVIAGVRGGFLNQGIITTALAGNVLDASSVVGAYPVPGTKGETTADVIGSDLTTNTTTIVGVQDGGFTNEIVSLDTKGSEVVTALNEDGTQRPEVIFNRVRTEAPAAAFLGTNLALDVVKLDVASTNTVKAKASASEYVLSSASTGDALADAKTGMSNVSASTTSIGGIDGNFYNSGMITSTLALNAITSKSLSTNTLTSDAIIGSNYEAKGLSYARINGDFVNDARLYDDDTSPTVNYYPVSDTNDTDSHVARSVTYNQDVVQGLIGTITSAGAPLALIATGTQAVTVNDMGVKEVKVVDVSSDALAFDADLNHTAVTERLSSNIKASNQAHSGVGGIFLNAGLMTTAATASPALIHLDSLDITGSSVTAKAIAGGTLEANNTVLNGTNLANTSGKTFADLRAINAYTTILPAGIDIKALNITVEGEDRDTDVIGFLNDKRDFNTVLESDADHDPLKVAVGTIASATLPVPISMLATGGATTDLTSIAAADGRLYTTDADKDQPYGTATFNHVENVNSVIKGDFVNLGTIATGTSPIASINMLATNNGASNDVHSIDGNKTNGGLLLSNTESHVNSYIDGDFINTGTIISPVAVLGINMEAAGGKSEIKGSLDSKELTEYAGANGKVVASNLQTTHSGAKHFFNSGEITHVLGTGISLTATGKADSTAFTFSDTNLTQAKNAVISNQVISDASLLSFTNSGLISANLGALNLSAEGEGKRATDKDDVNLASYENTLARVNASVGDIRNLGYTRQQAMWEVHKNFNTDNNDTTDDQLHATEERVTRNGGEYDLTTGELTATEGTFSTEDELNRLAFGVLDADQNTSAPILEQHQGVMTSLTTHVIGVKAVATGDENATVVTATTGHIINGGKITATAGIGIDISADGDAGTGHNKGAKAIATTGVIANLVTHDTFAVNDNSVFRNGSAKPTKGEKIHTVLTSEISGTVAGIKIDAVDAGDKDVSIATVEQIVNYRQVLNHGDLVIDSSGVDGDAEETADGKVKANGGETTTVTNRLANYGVKRITTDNVYNSVISGTGAGSSIIVGENAHVKDGILNYGELIGKVEIGDADLHLYGLVQNADKNETFGARPETDEMGLTDNYFAQNDDINETSAYVDAEDHIQVAGMITTDTPAKVTDAIIGSSISFHNSHILNTPDATYNADRIIIPKGSIVNIDENTEFITEARNPFDVNLSEGTHNMFTNSGYLNVRAGKQVKVTGNYEQAGGFFVTNVKLGSITAGKDDHTYDANDYGQLEVTGNADLTGGILVMMDDLERDLDAETQAAGHETRLKDVVIAGSLSSGSNKNITGAGGQGDIGLESTLTGITVQDNSRVFDFEPVTGTKTTDVSLRIKPQDPNAAPISIDTTNVAISAIKSTARVIASRIDSRPLIGGTTERPTVRFTATQTAPEVTPVEQETVARPQVDTATPTGSSIESRTTVLSQATEESVHQDLVLGTGAEITPSLTDYEIAKITDLNQTEKLNMWGKIYYSYGVQDGQTASQTVSGQTKSIEQSGYTSNAYGLVAGADKKYDDWFIGTAVAVGKSKASSSSGASTTSDTTMLQVTEYGSHPVADGRVNVQGSFAYLTNNKDRIDGTVGDGLGSDGKNYKSEYDGYALSAGVEYEQGFKITNETMIVPHVGLTGIYVENDAYTEKGGNNAQEVSSASSSAVIANIGARAQYKVTENSSLVVNADIGYDMVGNSVEYEARTALNPNTQTVHIEGAKPEPLEYDVGVGYQFVTPGNTIIRANADYRARDGYQETTGSLKVYYPF